MNTSDAIKSIGNAPLLWAIYLLLAVVTVVTVMTESEIAWLFMASGLLVRLLPLPSGRSPAR